MTTNVIVKTDALIENIGLVFSLRTDDAKRTFCSAADVAVTFFFCFFFHREALPSDGVTRDMTGEKGQSSPAKTNGDKSVISALGSNLARPLIPYYLAHR